MQDPRLAAPIRALGNDWDKTQDPSSHAKKRKLLDYSKSCSVFLESTQLTGDMLTASCSPACGCPRAHLALVMEFFTALLVSYDLLSQRSHKPGRSPRKQDEGLRNEQGRRSSRRRA